MSEYPKRLLPQPSYKIVAQEDISSQSGLWLIRHVDSAKSVFIERTRTINPECIEIVTDHLRDLSNNLLGIFQIEDTFFGIVKEAKELCDPWDGIASCNIPTQDQYFFDDNRGYYFISIDRLLEDKIKYFETGSEQEEVYHFKVLHTPTRSNFWHISIRVYDREEREVSALEISNGKKRRIWRNVKQYLILSVIRTEIPSEFSSLPEDLYSNA